MDEKHNEIVFNTLNLFCRYGIKGFTIEDICRRLGISKKTIYKYISNKNDLVEKTLDMSLEIMQKEIKAYYDIEGNAIDKIISWSKQMIETSRDLNATTVFELQEYYSIIYSKFLGQRKELIINLGTENIKQGISENLYRKAIPVDLYAAINFYISELFLNKELMQSLNNYSITQISIALIDNSIRGVVNENGLKYYEELIKKMHCK